MGVIYQATDTRLNREVAIKVLPEAFVEDAERLARFQREAQLLAALNHPNIGGIHGLEESDATRFLVLELIDGENLADRLSRGSIPVPEVLPVALQLAQALEAAHAQGIVHRDLKPANIKITPGGQVKVLDLGLGKVVIFEESVAGRSTDLNAANLEGERDPRPFRSGDGDETWPSFSPDGRWLAYQSNDSGTDEIYVTPFPGPGASWQASTGGGVIPRWSTDGRRLFFRDGERLLGADVAPGDELRFGRAEGLFELPGSHRM